MRDRLTKTLGFLKTTAIGGLIFLLPLAVLGGLLGYVYNMAVLVYVPLKDYLPVGGAGGIALLMLVGLALLVVICFMCGLAARRAIARKVSQTLEKHLVAIFPKYAIYKDIVAGNLGGDVLAPSLAPVAVQFDDAIRLGYEAGRSEQDLVIVYLPGAPDPWLGSVVLVEPDRVRPLGLDFKETAAICERLGRDSASLLAMVRRDRPPSATASVNVGN